jgi:hypothetical protein
VVAAIDIPVVEEVAGNCLPAVIAVHKSHLAEKRSFTSPVGNGLFGI